MFQAGGDPLALDAFGHLRSEFGDQERILSVTLDRAAPALVARHIQDGGVDAVVSDQAGLFTRDFAGPADQSAVPGAADRNRSRQGSRQGVIEAVDALVGEFGRNAEPRLFHEELLDLMQGLDMVAEGIDQVIMVLVAFAHAVEVLVDVGDAVFPDPLLPFRSRECPGQDTAVAVDRNQLAGFFVDRHLLQQVLDARINALRRIFIDVLDAVLVEVDPSFVVDGRSLAFAQRRCLDRLGSDRDN